MHSMKTGLQLFSIREQMQADFEGTLKQVKEAGYDGVELAGLYGISPEEIRKIADRLGLEIISAHVPYEELISNTEETAKTYQTLGCSYIAIPWIGDDMRLNTPGFEQMAAAIPELSTTLSNHGMVLLYHNHDFEFESNEKGYLLDQLYDRVDAKYLQTELDTCWVKVAGENPAAYIRKYSGRCPIVHIKDFTCASPVALAPVGEGLQDIGSLVNAASECGTKWMIVEQDDHPTGNPMDNIKISIQNLKKY